MACFNHIQLLGYSIPVCVRLSVTKTVIGTKKAAPHLPERLFFDTPVVLDDGLMMIMMILEAARMSVKTH